MYLVETDGEGTTKPTVGITEPTVGITEPTQGNEEDCEQGVRVEIGEDCCCGKCSPSRVKSCTLLTDRDGSAKWRWVEMYLDTCLVKRECNPK